MKAEILVNLMNTAKNELDRFVADLSDTERNKAGAPDHWSVKDVVAHLGTGQCRLVNEIDRVEAGEKLPEWGDLDAANLVIFQQNEHRCWDDVWRDAERCSQAAIQRTSSVTEEVLNTQVQDGRSFARVIFGNSFMHWIEHLISCCLERGDVTNAERLVDLECCELQTFDPSPRTQAVASYNRACFFARTTQTEKAVKLLSEVFWIRPDLRDWAKQDGDLVNLRGLKEFEDLFPAG